MTIIEEAINIRNIIEKFPDSYFPGVDGCNRDFLLRICAKIIDGGVSDEIAKEWIAYIYGVCSSVEAIVNSDYIDFSALDEIEFYEPTSITNFILDYRKFDELVNMYVPSANRKYEVIAYEEWNNDESHSWYGDGILDCQAKEDIDKGKLKFNGPVLLNFLIAKGVLPFGRYIIEVSW